MYHTHRTQLYFVFDKKGSSDMTALSKKYLLLFNTVTDTEKTLALLRESLLEAQRQAEELFLEEPEETPPDGADRAS